jgi:hypothetical protein
MSGQSHSQLRTQTPVVSQEPRVQASLQSKTRPQWSTAEASRDSGVGLAGD